MHSSSTPIRQPGEWEYHSAVWTGWPSHAAYWDGNLEAARGDVASFLRKLVEPLPGKPPPEAVRLWVDGTDALTTARSALAGLPIEYVEQPFGDIWFRDIGPIFVRKRDGSVAYRTFRYNGWGEKYRMANDDTVASRIAAMSGLAGRSSDLILEGGALDVNGNGLALTTRSCLLNPNRNPSWSQLEIETCLADHLGIRSLIWLEDGLLNDHTDGHVDNIARFVDPFKVVCQHPSGMDDPNAPVLRKIVADLRAWRSDQGESLEVVEIPSPGRVTDSAGRIVPASHLNFYIANHRVIVPCYGTSSEGAAIEDLQSLFPDREVIGSPATGLLNGGGAFHCITQQQPA